MNDLITFAAQAVVAYPSIAHVRRHGPVGYADYRAFKPWLRDEFAFRCIYCLTRERWCPSGHEEFAVEHSVPRSAAPERSGDYDNLLYACASCNRNRQDIILAIDPASEPLGKHLRVTMDGKTEPLTNEGRDTIRVCHLNRPLLVQFRQRLQGLINRLLAMPTPETAAVLHDILSFPDDLPDLAVRRPPGGNTRPDGIAASYYEQKRRGELPPLY